MQVQAVSPALVRFTDDRANVTSLHKVVRESANVKTKLHGHEQMITNQFPPMLPQPSPTSLHHSGGAECSKLQIPGPLAWHIENDLEEHLCFCVAGWAAPGLPTHENLEEWELLGWRLLQKPGWSPGHPGTLGFPACALFELFLRLI